MKRLRLSLVSSLVVASAAVVLIAPSGAAAYGSGAKYEVTFSSNCNNVSLCTFGTGGAWGWFELDLANHTGDGTVTFCFHTPGGGGPGSQGASHENPNITAWSVNGSGNFNIDAATGGPIIFPGGDTGIPASPGQYHMVLGPGFVENATVTLVTG
jgi:hypothetical protein